MVRGVSLAAMAIGVWGLIGTAATAQQIQLRITEGNQVFRGEFVSQTDTHVVVKSRFGEIQIAKRDVECMSGNCPWESQAVSLDQLGDGQVPAAGQVPASAATGLASGATAGAATGVVAATAAAPARTAAANLLEPDLLIRGSDTVGEELMPLLLEGYANEVNAAVIARQDQGDDLVALDVHTDFGSGERLFVAAVESKGSSTGLRALLSDEADIAMTSRAARASEVEALASQGRGDLRDLSQEYIVAVDSVMVVVSPENPIQQISVADLAGVLSGRIQNWAEVGGANVPVTVYSRDADSGTFGLISNAILRPSGEDVSPAAVITHSHAEMADRVAGDPGGIGFVGFASVRGAKPVELISACGIPLDGGGFGAKTEEYPLQRRLRLYVDNAARDAMTDGLLAYAISPRAEGLVQKAGFIDLGIVESDDDLDAERIRSATADARDPFATRLLSVMALDLNGARRLSTTFRFATGSSRLDNKAQRDLARTLEYINRPENASRELVIAGFTDSDGPFGANAALAERRANAVLQALLQKPDGESLRGRQIRTAGYGELSPVACNETFEGRVRNRRVEIWMR